VTAPSVTFGHGFCQDAWANLTDDYTLTTVTATAGVTAGQNLYITEASWAGVSPYVQNDDDISASTTTYPSIMIRYKTSGSSSLTLTAIFNDAATQAVLTAQTSSTWKTVTVTLTASKILDHLKIALATGNGSVYVDFILVFTGTLSFPQYAALNWIMENRYSNTEIPSRAARRKAWIGAKEIGVTISGDIDSTNSTYWKRPLGTTGAKTDTFAGQVLEDIFHNAYDEPFQWLTTDRGAFKAVMDNLAITENNSQDYLYSYVVVFSEYRMEKAQNDTLAERLKLV